MEGEVAAMRNRLRLRFRVWHLLLLAWPVSLWIFYWSGYWGGFVSSMRGEYAFISASAIYDIHQLKALMGTQSKKEELERSLMVSIETKLATLSGTKKLLDDEHPYFRRFLYSFYETPKMAYLIDSDQVNLADVSEIEKRYREVANLAERK